MGAEPLSEFEGQQYGIGQLGHVRPPLVVVGLRAEARLLAGPHMHVVIGGGDTPQLATAIEAQLQDGASGIISFGLAGGLARGLLPGTVVIGSAICAGTDRFEADAEWAQSLAAALPGAMAADILGIDRPVETANAKQALHAATGAIAVDMESHIAARAAARSGVPFAALRVVADPSDYDLPPAVLVAMRSDGAIAGHAILRSLRRDPRQLPALIRTARHARMAMRVLRKIVRDLSPSFGLPTKSSYSAGPKAQNHRW